MLKQQIQKSFAAAMDLFHFKRILSREEHKHGFNVLITFALGLPGPMGIRCNLENRLTEGPNQDIMAIQ
jgi:hypothetical protein